MGVLDIQLLNLLLQDKTNTSISIDMKFINTFCTLFIILSVYGCMPLARYYVGFSEPKFLTNEEILQYANKLRIDEEYCFKMDTSYISYLLKFRDNNELSGKNHLQPIQASIFNKQKELIGFYLSCYATGIYKINWNETGIFNEFPPDLQAPLDSLFDYHFFLDYLSPTSNNQINIENINTDYVLIVFWAQATKRHSKSLIEQINSNISLKGDSVSSVVLYVNYDNCMAFMSSLGYR